ncbi:hypothetical protein EV1_034186 [Malus domestica]
MGNLYEASNGHMVARQSKVSLPWLDVRVFYVRISKCEIDDSAPEFLTVNHIPLDPDTLLEVNGVRTSIYSDGATTILPRDRLDKKSEEATFVSTDSIRMTGNRHGQRWSMSCESDIVASTGFFKGRQFMGPESTSPSIEVYIAGSFSGTPIILTKTLLLGLWKKHARKGLLDSRPEYEATEDQKNNPPPRFSFQIRWLENTILVVAQAHVVKLQDPDIQPLEL